MIALFKFNPKIFITQYKTINIYLRFFKNTNSGIYYDTLHTYGFIVSIYLRYNIREDYICKFYFFKWCL